MSAAITPQQLASLFPRPKGIPKDMWDYPATTVPPGASYALSDYTIDCGDWNALDFQVKMSGTTPSVDVQVVQGDAAGGSNFLPVPDSAGKQTAVTTSKGFRCEIGRRYVRIQLSNFSGTGVAVQVSCIPYLSGASTEVTVNNTADQNLAQVGGATVSLGQKVAASSIPVTLASDKPIPVDPSTGTLTDRSGTITAGGTAQQLAAANTNRRYLLIQNEHATETLWFNFTTTATAAEPSFQIPAGGSFVMEAGYISTEAVSVIAATTGHPWTAKEG